MTPVTRDEPPAKKAKETDQQLVPAGKMPADMDHRHKLPLHVMNGVFGYLSREGQEEMRPVCKFWDRCLSTHPSHFQPLFQFDYLNCEWYASGQQRYMSGELWWPVIERPLDCCGHLEGLANDLVGELFIPTLTANMKIALQMKATPNGKWIYYLFDNKLTKYTARRVLHLFAHLREISFNCIRDCKAGSFLLGVRPEVAKMFLPTRCRSLVIESAQSTPEPEVPSLESLAAIVKHKEVEWHFGFRTTPPPPEQVKDVLEKFAIDTRHLHESLKISTYFYELFDENDRWVALFKEVIEFLSERLKESHAIVPRIEFTFVSQAPAWPLAPFSQMQPISQETEEQHGGWVTVTKRTFKHNIGGGPNAKTFQTKLICHQFGTGAQVRANNIAFLFE